MTKSVLNKYNGAKEFKNRNIIGREEEIFDLNKILENNDNFLSVITGRRRVGKTYWLDSTIKNYIKNNQEKNKNLFYLYFTGSLKTSKNENLSNFFYFLKNFIAIEPCLNDLIDYFHEDKKFKNWNEFFEALVLINKKVASLSTENVLFLVFDEVPWMDGHHGYLYKDGFKETCSYYWNAFFDKGPITTKIFLTGSATTWMIKNIIQDEGGFYGRIRRHFHLKPFNIIENYQYLKTYFNKKISIQESLYYYFAFGGVAYYLSLLQNNERSFEQNIKEIFNRNELKNEYHQLFFSLFKANDMDYNFLSSDFENIEEENNVKTIKNNNKFSVHKTIVESIASKKTKSYTINEIIEIVQNKSAFSKNTIKNAIFDLIHSDFLKENGLFETKTKLKKYSINDLFTLFYLKWIKNDPSLSEFRIDNKSFNIWSGFAFEIVCFNQIDFLVKHIGLKHHNISCSYWKKTTDKKDDINKKGSQIDLLIKEGKIVYLTEIKFYEKDKFILGKDEILNLRNKFENFKEKYGYKYEVRPLFITMNGIKFNYNMDNLFNSFNSYSIELNRILMNELMDL